MQCPDDLERFSRLSGRELQDALQIKLEDWKQHPREAAQVWRKIAQQKQIQKSLQVLRFLYHHRVEAADAISFNMAMAASAKASSWQSSFEYLELLQQSQVRATTVTFNTVINVYGQASGIASKWQLGLALKDSTRMAAMLPDAAMQNLCTSTCARLQKWQNAIQLLEEGSSEIENGAFNAALTSIVSNRWSVGQCLFTSMLSLRIPPDGFTYSALANVSPWQDAVHTTSHSKVEYDAVLCGALLASCETQWALAVQFLHGMQGRRLADAVAINSAINAADKSHRWELALLLLRSMSGANTRSDAYSFSSAIGCLTWKFAFALLSNMQTREVNANLVCLNAAISACEKHGAWMEALDLLVRQFGDTTSFNTAISACSRARNWPMAIAILRVMARDNIAQDAISFRAAISACEGGNCWKEALNLLSEMESRQLRPETTGYNAAISACEKGSQWELALGLSARAQQQAVSLDVITFNAKIAACRSTWRTTQRLLSELCLQLLQLDEITYNSAICAQGHWRSAVTYLSEMANSGLWPDVITCNSILQTMQISGPKWHAVCLLFDRVQNCATAITFDLLMECVSPKIGRAHV